MDIRYFFVAYGLAVGAAFVPADLVVLRYVAVVFLIGIYAWYVKKHFEAEAAGGEGMDLAPLRFHRMDRGSASSRPRGTAPARRQLPGARRARQ